MRYCTVGDYYKTKTGWDVVSADLKDPDYNFLILVHELIELYLTQRRGIPEPKIKKFDEWFQREKTKGRFRRFKGGASLKLSPYRREHLFALKIEKLLAKELGKNWKKYDEAVDITSERIKEILKNK
ncbi:MAG: hypothetical protein Q8O83_01020 [bacterium]|nr:hypothetical protein [bacterium]